MFIETRLKAPLVRAKWISHLDPLTVKRYSKIAEDSGAHQWMTNTSRSGILADMDYKATFNGMLFRTFRVRVLMNSGIAEKARAYRSTAGAGTATSFADCEKLYHSKKKVTQHQV